MPHSLSNNRLFIPHDPKTLLDDISTYHDGAGLTYLTSTSICIRTAGATPPHISPVNKAAYGVYFGPNSSFNRCALIPTKEHQSSNLAELFAVRMALQIVLTALCPSPRSPAVYSQVKEVILATESNWMVDMMCKWIWEWQQNKWKASFGETIMFERIISRIYNQISLAESRYGISIKFWKVDSESVAGANRLAHVALRNYMHGDFEQYLSAPEDLWTYAGCYMRPASWRLRHTNLTISRLDLPILGNTPWISSVKSYLFRQITLEESTTVFSFREKLARFFGPENWERVVADERCKLMNERSGLAAIRLGKVDAPLAKLQEGYDHVPGDTAVRKLVHLNTIVRRMDHFEFPCPIEMGKRVVYLYG